jgi:hypothetical protein
MKCQSFPFFGLLFALAFAPGLTSVHAAGETALDTAMIETITGFKGVSNQAEGTFKDSKPPGMMLRSSSSRCAWLHYATYVTFSMMAAGGSSMSSAAKGRWKFFGQRDADHYEGPGLRGKRKLKRTTVLRKNREALSSKMGSSYLPEKVDGDKK